VTDQRAAATDAGHAATEPAPGATAHAAAEPATVHDAVRLLARTAGNRAVVQMLARHGTTAVNPATAPTTTRADPRFAKVDADLTFSQWGWQAMGVMDKYNVMLVLTDQGAPASFLPDYNRCVINVARPSHEVAAYFVHEMHHAVQYHEGRSPKATTMAKPDWVRMMVKEEVDGTQKGFLHKLALESFGRAPKDDLPAGMHHFRSAYRYGKEKAVSEGKEGVPAGDAARANAYKMVRWMIEDPTGQTATELGPNQFDSYERYYRREWTTQNPAAPAATPHP
jgi:hypothetical protein